MNNISEQSTSRVTCKRHYLINQFLIEFLTEFREFERARNSESTMIFTYKNAIESVKKYPLEIRELDELKKLKFFGNVIIRKLERRLAEYRKEHGQLTWDLIGSQPTVKKSYRKVNQSNTTVHSICNPESGEFLGTFTEVLSNCSVSTCQNKRYVPKRGTGAYAILIALFEHINGQWNENSCGLALSELRTKADRHSKEPMVRSTVNQFYTPFSCLKTLKEKNLVKTHRVGRKDAVLLTEDGFVLARSLVQPDYPNGLEASKIFDASGVQDSSHKTCKTYKKKSKRGNFVESESLTKKRFISGESPSSVYNISVVVADSSDVEPEMPLSSANSNLPTPRGGRDVNPKLFSDNTMGYIYLTSELMETKLKFEACSQYDHDLGVRMLWIKSTKHYLESLHDVLYKLPPNHENLLKKPYIIAHLFDEDASFIAPGFKNQRINSQAHEFTMTRDPKIDSKKRQINVSDFAGETHHRMYNNVEHEEYKSIPITDLFQGQISSEKNASQFSDRKRTALSTSLHSSPMKSHLEPESKIKFVLIPDGFDIILLVDNAEIKEGSTFSGSKRNLLLEYLRDRSIRFETRKLNAGDYLWVARKSGQGSSDRHDEETELVLDVVIERKRMDDLASSIKDGRWHSQKYRLKNCGLKETIYLFEQLPKSFKINTIDPQVLESAIINTEVQDEFIVHRSDGLKETVDYLFNMMTLLTKTYRSRRLIGVDERYIVGQPKSGNDKPCDSLELITLASFQKKVEKPRSFRIGEVSIMLLTQIPGLSFETAKCIAQSFGTLNNIYNRIKNSPEEISLELQRLKVGSSGGRHLGPALSKKIIDFFLA